MRALLVDADSQRGFPNLALMKISTWLKIMGYDVDLIKGIPEAPPIEEYEQYYISVIFFQNKERVQKYANMLPIQAHIGGAGWDFQNKLPDGIEYLKPDYELYGYDYSLGFTSRGCIRKCGFCIVPKKEGTIKDHQHVSEFHDSAHSNIILLDNNFQASPNWKKNLDYINGLSLRVNFNQGLDLRIMNRDFADILAQTKTFDWTFKYKRLNFAFDDLRDKNKIIKGLNILEEAGISKRILSVYMITGYNTTRKEDLERFEILKEHGIRPYIMRYNQCADEWLKHFARYVNRRYFEFIPFEKYKDGLLKK